MPTTAPRILLILPTDIETGRGILRGVRDYARRETRWVFQVLHPHLVDWPLVAAARPDGIIAHLHRHSLAAMVRRLHKPVVNVSNVIGDRLGFPRVGSDDAAVGKVAAEHFLERGFRQFGFFGYPAFTHSRGREQGFRDRLAAAKCACSTFATRPPAGTRPREPWAGLDERVRPWLHALPKPVAIFTPSAERGFELLEVCRQERLAVPHTVAVLGVDNDELICELAMPPLSAIRTATEQIGSAAAAVLARLLAGGAPPAGPVLVPPGEVVVRQSTDVLAVHDPALEKALRYIRDHLERPLGVAEIARVAGVSRRRLERKFRQTVGVSALQEIRRRRLERAQQLLSETHLSIPEVAVRCGVATAPMLADLFRQCAGCTPTAWRRRFGTLVA